MTWTGSGLDTGAVIGRTDARALIDALLDRARSSVASTLTLVGEAGIGKTMLCDYAVDRAMRSGFTTVRAAGVEWEAGFELAAMTQLIRPLQPYFAGLPREQREQLTTVIDGSSSIPPHPYRFAAAALSALVAAAEDNPLLLVIDDVHWIDGTSAAVIGFIVRRLFADAIAVLFAQRDGQQEMLPTNWPRHIIAPLETQDVTELLAGLRPDLPNLPTHLAAAIAHRAAGNPLAVHELAPHLTAQHVSMAWSLPDPLPLGPRGYLNFGPRIRALRPPALEALALIAAAGSQTSLIPSAFTRLGIPTEAVDAGIDAGLLVTAAPWRFVHPLCRSAAYAAASALERRQIHRTLADLNRNTDPERFAWHIDAAGAEPTLIADAYETAAQAITSRAGVGAAAASWTRSTELSPPGPLRYQRAVQAATSLFTAGDRASCERWLDEILAAAERNAEFDLEVFTSALLMRCQSAVWYMAQPEQLQHLVSLVQPLERLDPARLVVALGLLSAGFENRGDLKMASELTDRAAGIASKLSDLDALIALCWKAHTDTLTVGAKGTVPIEQLVPLDKILQLAADNPMHIWTVAQTAQWQENFPYAAQVADTAVSTLRQTGNISWLPYALAVDSQIRWWLGSWHQARAAANESLDLAREANQQGLLGFNQAAVGIIAASIGQEDECRRVLNSALDHCRTTGLAPVELYAEHAYGLLELGLGHPGAAVEHLERAHAVAIALQLAPVLAPVVPYLADLIEALVRAGETDRARLILTHLETTADVSGSRWAAGAFLRCQGMLEPDPDRAATLIERSIAHFTDRTPLPFERFRSHLELGMQLRRRRALATARRHLAAAANGFAALGAVPWHRRALNEARAAGDRTPAASPDDCFNALSPQQLQVVLSVSRGATNREAATALFISPKTVDYHLRRAYTLLGVRNRTELARLVAGVNPGMSALSPPPESSPDPATSASSTRTSNPK